MQPTCNGGKNIPGKYNISSELVLHKGVGFAMSVYLNLCDIKALHSMQHISMQVPIIWKLAQNLRGKRKGGSSVSQKYTKQNVKHVQLNIDCHEVYF